MSKIPKGSTYRNTTTTLALNLKQKACDVKKTKQ